VKLSDEGAGLDLMRCQNCSLCASACRTGAWLAANLPRVDLLKQAIKASRWSFACAPSCESADAIVPCLGGLDAATLAYLGKRRIPVELRGTGHCAECAHGARGRAQVEANLEAAAVLRRGSGEEWPAVAVATVAERKVKPDDFAPGRRQLFRRLLGGGSERARDDTGAPAAEPVPDRALRAGRPFVTEPRELVQIIAKGAPAGFTVHEHEALPLLALAMADGCIACEACFRACPTGALQVRENETTWSLVFQVDACVACEVCIEVCRPGVLHPAPEFDVTPGRTEANLFALGRQRCDRCDRAFVSPAPAATCPVCADDERAFDAIFG